MPCLLYDNDTCHNIVEPRFLRLLELRYVFGGLEMKIMLRHDFSISEIDGTRHERVNSLKACKLQSQLAIGELRASRTTLSKCIDSSCGSEVLSWDQFHNVCFLKIRYFSFQGPMW